MARGKKHTAEQIVNLLQVEVGVANGKTLPPACKEAEIGEQTYYRWRRDFGGLKVDQDADYEDKQMVLEPKSSLLFLSDGVVEARSPSGELFGFDRTLAISTFSAQEFARSAVIFGQEDDITVLTLMRVD